jgi:hypothetical protein
LLHKLIAVREIRNHSIVVLRLLKALETLLDEWPVGAVILLELILAGVREVRLGELSAQMLLLLLSFLTKVLWKHHN